MTLNIYIDEEELKEINEFRSIMNMYDDMWDYYHELNFKTSRFEKIEDTISYILFMVGRSNVKKEIDKLKFDTNSLAEKILVQYEKEHNLNEGRHQC